MVAPIRLQLIRKSPQSTLQEAERRIKKWLQQQTIEVDVAELETTPETACAKIQELVTKNSGQAGLLIPLGFEEDELASAGDLADLIEVVSFRLNFDREPSPPNASLLNSAHAVTDMEHLDEALRKACIRLWAKLKGVRVREVRDDELDAYFRLRYEVYKPLNFIPPHLDAAESGWELRFSDRWSIPLGAFMQEDLIGCGRVVSVYGSVTNCEARITRLLEGRDDPVLARCWEIPRELPHPFDLLAPFSAFEDYYRELVMAKVRKAEVSRIIVKPEHRGEKLRGHGLGEVIVDSLITEVERRDLQLLFLACQERHAEFYARCGFTAIPGMKCDRFGDFPVPAIAMERWLDPSKMTRA